MNETRIKEVFSDDVFVNSLREVSDIEKMQKMLQEKGLEFNLDQVKQIQSNISKAELDLDELDNVAGGSKSLAIIGIVAIIRV